MLVALVAPVWCAARAAVIDGVQLPPTLQVFGQTLQLNGSGLRTYSILGIHIYVVGLYLEHLSTNAEAILQSPETKLLTVRFEHDVGAEEARNAWRVGLQNNCVAPCQLDPQDEANFLAMVPGMHAGDGYDLLFTPNGATVSVNGKLVGTVTKPQFAVAMLATFLGPKPAAPDLKRDLLAGHP
jgi:hypothetical protein